MAADPEWYFRNLVTFFHTLILKRNLTLSDKDAPVPLQNERDIQYQDYHSTGHCLLQEECWEQEGLWVLSFIAPVSSMGDLIKGSLHVNNVSEAFVLAFLQQCLYGPISLPLTNHPFQRKEIKAEQPV